MESYIKDKSVLAVDDEVDILETIEEILDDARVDTAQDFEAALKKINENQYDVAILDIMGVDGMQLLDACVKRGIPAVMLTAHAINPETLMESVRNGAISYLPKESLSELDVMLNEILSAHDRGEPSWKLLFEKLGDYFDKRFGADWKEKDREFWSEFSRTYQVGKGIQERLKQDSRVADKGF